MTQAAQEIVTREEAQPIAVASEAAAIISMIERAARDPNVDIAKMERLFEMQERAEARRAKAAYAAALALMQPKLPTVERKGRIIITDKNDRQKVIQSTPYALWEDTNEAIRPILAEHQFALTFRTGSSPDGKITVTGLLSHAAGHSEETTITLMHDSSGSKNSVQAVGSSISYGKRYTAGLLLNLTSRGEDDDGKAAGTGETLSDDQINKLRAALEFVGGNEKRFLEHIKMESFEDILASKFDDCLRIINARRQGAAK